MERWSQNNRALFIVTQDQPRIPLRTCLGCGEQRDKFALVRLVVDNAEILKIDWRQTEAGRGSYLCPDGDCLRRFFSHRRWKRLRVPWTPLQRDHLKRELEMMIQPNKIESLVGLANRVGKVALGQQAVEIALKKRQARLVILAADAAANTMTHFSELIQKSRTPVLTTGLKSDRGRLFARDSVAVLAILHDGFARAIGNLNITDATHS